MNLGKLYKTEKIIESSMMDSNYVLKITEITKMAQDAAANQCVFCKSSIPDLRQKGYTWVIVKQHFEINEYPRWLDKTTITTWSKGKQGFFWMRDVLFEKTGSLKLSDETSIKNSETENDLCLAPETFTEKKIQIKALNSWMILDLNTGHPLRNPTDFDIEKNILDKEGLPPVFPKIKLPETFETEIFIKPDEQDIDMNGHINNNNYIRWFISSIPSEVKKDNLISVLDTYFTSAAHLNDTILCRSALIPNEENTDTISYVSVLTNKETGTEFFRAKTTWKNKDLLINKSWKPYYDR